MDRLAGGRKEETYWPVAVAQGKFHCIILKGGDQYPYFPRPLLSEFEFRVPFSSPPQKDHDGENEDEGTDAETARNAGQRLEEFFVRENLAFSLLQDCVLASEGTALQDGELRRKELDIDKILLQMLAVECREGEGRGMKALEVVRMMRDRTGKMLDAASKVAQRYERYVLDEKIRELASKRLIGQEDEVEDGGDDDDDDELG
jgi:chromosome transmission fidelity protein 4